MPMTHKFVSKLIIKVAASLDHKKKVDSILLSGDFNFLNVKWHSGETVSVFESR